MGNLQRTRMLALIQASGNEDLIAAAAAVSGCQSRRLAALYKAWKEREAENGERDHELVGADAGDAGDVRGSRRHLATEADCGCRGL